jgi:putative ABC transport system permease protein
VIVSLALCVASTLFLLLLGDKIGLGILGMGESRLSASFLTVFSRFIVFMGFLIFFVGVMIVSFTVFAMLSQRTRDIGLMKAVGCPNDLVFGYFMNELLIVAFVGCLLGVVFGLIADYGSTLIFKSINSNVASQATNFWLALIIFVVFFVLSIIVGAKPILDVTKVEPAKALSPSFSLGLGKESDFGGVSKAGLAIKLAVRSLFRRKSVSLRIILCLTAVFTLTTVGIAGGIIARETSKSWVERAVGRDIVLIAHRDMCDQYQILLSKFHETGTSKQLNYSDRQYMVSEEMLNLLGSIDSLSVDARLITEAQIREVQGIILGQETGSTTYVGDNRKGVSLIVGVEPSKVLGNWFTEGEFLDADESSEAVIGDAVAQIMFSSPLDQNLTISGENFRITGVCLDPINNGNVTYVPLKLLQNMTDAYGPNVLMIKIRDSVDRKTILEQVRISITSVNPDFRILELNKILDENLSFLDYLWSTMMFLPFFSLLAATLCLVGYVVLSINEQRQEFGILRAVGARPRTIVRIVATQNLLVLLSSCAAGIALGMMTTLLILVQKPFVTSYTTMEIVILLFAALAAAFAASLYPALRFARRHILEIIAHT